MLRQRNHFYWQKCCLPKKVKHTKINTLTTMREKIPVSLETWLVKSS